MLNASYVLYKSVSNFDILYHIPFSKHPTCMFNRPLKTASVIYLFIFEYYTDSVSLVYFAHRSNSFKVKLLS